MSKRLARRLLVLATAGAAAGAVLAGCGGGSSPTVSFPQVGAAKTYTAADLTQPTALIVGAEDEGLDAHWREAADMQVSIPMRARTADSLNAATSAALLLYEAVRQRG